jgi:hypothetical protein
LTASLETRRPLGRLAATGSLAEDAVVDPFSPSDDVTLILDVLLDVRRKVDRIIYLLEDEDEEEENA